MELRSLDYKFGGRNAEDTKREVNDLNKEIGVTREVRVTTLGGGVGSSKALLYSQSVGMCWYRPTCQHGMSVWIQPRIWQGSRNYPGRSLRPGPGI